MSSLYPAGTNLLVASLSDAGRASLEWVVLEACEIVAEPGQPPAHVYFPAGCAIGLLLPLAEGVTGLAAIVGSEGVIGVESFLGSGSRVTQAIAMVQSGGPASRLSAAQFELEVANNFTLQQRLTRYTLALVSQMARTAACARQHAIEQQIARWLLQSWDRVPALTLPLNAEGVATLLGLDRDATMRALDRMERGGGIVRDDAGRLTLGDRVALEAGVCACYGAIRESELRALLSDVLTGNPPPQRQDLASEPVDS